MNSPHHFLDRLRRIGIPDRWSRTFALERVTNLLGDDVPFHATLAMTLEEGQSDADAADSIFKLWDSLEPDVPARVSRSLRTTLEHGTEGWKLPSSGCHDEVIDALLDLDPADPAHLIAAVFLGIRPRRSSADGGVLWWDPADLSPHFWMDSPPAITALAASNLRWDVEAHRSLIELTLDFDEVTAAGAICAFGISPSQIHYAKAPKILREARLAQISQCARTWASHCDQVHRGEPMPGLAGARVEDDPVEFRPRSPQTIDRCRGAHLTALAGNLPIPVDHWIGPASALVPNSPQLLLDPSLTAEQVAAIIHGCTTDPTNVRACLAGHPSLRSRA